ncbi:hypothetical protein BZZ01_13655 [Nostocales cyanobacterium HT-58-2]|nr:hypothetical protein BZZ01_13655 [Nostocales cyanobacterium HT-58-2]
MQILNNKKVLINKMNCFPYIESEQPEAKSFAYHQSFVKNMLARENKVFTQIFSLWKCQMR